MTDTTQRSIVVPEPHRSDRRPTLRSPASTAPDDLDLQLQRLSHALGEPCQELLASEHFDQLIALIESQPRAIGAHERQRILQQIEDRRSEALDSIRQAFEYRINLGDLPQAATLIERAQRVDAQAGAALEMRLRQAQLHHRRMADRVKMLADARRMARDGHLEQMRDARAIFETLLDGPTDATLDDGQLRRELMRLDAQIDFEMAAQAATHTKMQLSSLQPKLEALADLRGRRQRGEQRFYAQGDRAEPLPAVIDRLECELRPLLFTRVESDLEGADRLVADGSIEPALRRLDRYHAYWSLLDDDLRERAVTRKQALEAALERQARIDAAVDRAFALMEAGDMARTAEFIELSRARLGGEVPRLDELLVTMRRHRLLPLINRVDDLIRQAMRLTGLWSKHLDGLLAQAEALTAPLGEMLSADGDHAALRDRHQALLSYLRGLVEARELHDAGRFEPARCQLSSLALALPTYADAIRLHLDGQSADRTIEELLARVRALYSEDPEKALALARENAAQDGRIRDFTDFVSVERALHRADALERRGQYPAALELLQGTWGQLSTRESDVLDRAIERLTSVVADAPLVAELLAQTARAASTPDKEALASRLSELAVGVDRADGVKSLLAAQIPHRMQALRDAMAGWRQTGAFALEAVEADARFLRAQVRPPGPELAHLLREYDFAAVLLEADHTLHSGAFDEAEALVEPFLGGAFGGRAKAFIVRCRAQRALAGAYAALAELDMDAARAALQSGPAADLQVQAARLFVERFDAAVAPLLAAAPRTPGLTGDATGRDASGPDATGPDATGPDATGPDATGQDATGQDATGPDAIEAFRIARALIAEQPETIALQQSLMRLTRARTTCTRARIASETPRLPGVQIAVMAWLARDCEAAGGVEPEFEAMLQQARQQAPDDLRALFAWVERHERAVDHTREDDVRVVVDRLRAAQTLRGDLPRFASPAEIEGFIERADQLRARADRRSADRAQIVALLERSRAEGAREPLERAAELEASHPDQSIGARERLDAWHRADAIEAQLVELHGADRIAEALDQAHALARLREQQPLPHGDRLRLLGPDRRVIGPGLAALIPALTRELEHRQARQSVIADELAAISLTVDAFEIRRDRLIEVAVRERDPSEVDEQLRRLAVEVESVTAAMRAHQLEAKRLGNPPLLPVLLTRLASMTHEALEQEVSRRRRDVGDAVRILNEYRRKGERVIERQFDDIERLGMTFRASARVQRYVNHFRLLLKRAPALPGDRAIG